MSSAPKNPRSDEENAPQKKQRRAFKACDACKKRKLRCNLGDNECPRPPCARCMRAARECVFSDIKIPRRSKANRTASADTNTLQNIGMSFNLDSLPKIQSKNSNISADSFTSEEDEMNDEADEEDQANKTSKVLVRSTLHNPGDALKILLMGAAAVGDEELDSNSPKNAPQYEFKSGLNVEECWNRWGPVKKKILSVEQAVGLLNFFNTKMSTLYPLLMPQIQSPTHLATLTSTESFLLLVMILIASRYVAPFEQNVNNLPAYTTNPGLELHKRLGKEMRKEMSKLMRGDTRMRSISTIEGLLLLAEWTPVTDEDSDSDDDSPAEPTHFDENDKGISGKRVDGFKRFVQPATQYDALNWTFTGMAVRLAGELGLQNHSMYPVENTVKSKNLPWRMERNLRTWLYCYNADRHASIRLGRNTVIQVYMTSEWWEKVISKVTRNASVKDSFIYADEAMSQGYLAALMGTIQDRLYPNHEVTGEILRTGLFEAFLRSLQQEIRVIRRNATDMLSSNTLHAQLLEIEINYVHLYGNAIALRSLQERLKRRMKEPLSVYYAPSILNLAEGPWCLDAMASAESILKISVTQLAPEGFLRLCPSRLLFRILFAATFLFKALAVGVVEHGQPELLGLLDQTIHTLHESSLDDDHISRGFAALMGLMRSHCVPTVLSERKKKEDPHAKKLSGLTPFPLPTSQGNQNILNPLQPPQADANPAGLNVGVEPAVGWPSAGFMPLGSSFVLNELVDAPQKQTQNQDQNQNQSQNVQGRAQNGGFEFEGPLVQPGMNQDWDAVMAAIELGRGQDQLLREWWSQDVVGAESNLHLLGTFLGDF